MSTWPDPSVLVPTDQVDNDSDSATLARSDINTCFTILNQIIGTMAVDATPTTDKNDASYMKNVSGTTDQRICILDVNGKPLNSAKTIATSISNDPNSVPTTAAVNFALAGAGGKNDIIAGDSSTNGYLIFDNPNSLTHIMVQWGFDANGYYEYSPNFSAEPYILIGTNQATSKTSSSISVDDRWALNKAASFNMPDSSSGVHWLAIGPY